MQHKNDELIEKAKNIINASQNLKELDEVRVKYLGKKGEITNLLKNMKNIPADQRPEFGKVVNEMRETIETLIENAKEEKKKAEIEHKLLLESIDVTMPSNKTLRGHKHPINVALDEVKEIFIGMGFKIAEGPEIETVYNNFDALNAPIDHPARSLSDTFYISDTLILRTQTSPIQVRTMKNQEPPIKIIAPGRCFRNDEIDATHSPMFHQIEGLVIDKDITMADLKGTLDQFAKRLFGPETKTKFRPHHFPFTEPSGEVDVSCFKCGGEGCRFCSGSGWIEILGCGMVHPNVLMECGIDPEKYNGFAFGMGLDRITMLKYEIDDIRILFENDTRFIKQF